MCPTSFGDHTCTTLGRQNWASCHVGSHEDDEFCFELEVKVSKSWLPPHQTRTQSHWSSTSLHCHRVCRLPVQIISVEDMVALTFPSRFPTQRCSELDRYRRLIQFCFQRGDGIGLRGSGVVDDNLLKFRCRLEFRLEF